MWTVEDAKAILKSRGAKITTQRMAILELLEGRTDHPSADVLYKELVEKYPCMSVATVYSTAQLFADAGLIKILSIDDKRVYFDPTTLTHGHFLCKSCGGLTDLKIDEEGFFHSAVTSGNKIAQIDNAEIFLYGLCVDCFEKKPEKK